MQNLINLCKPSLTSPRFVAGEVREHEVRRGMCVLWVASNKRSKSFHSWVSPLGSGPQRELEVQVIHWGNAKVKGRGIRRKWEVFQTVVQV